MQLPVSINFTANAQQAMQGITMVGQGLQHLAGRPIQAATMGFRQFNASGTEALSNLKYQLSDVETQWMRFTGFLGVPLSLGGIWGAVAGVKSLKTALIDTNAEMEMSRARLGALIRDYDDTREEGMTKAVGLTDFIEKYAIKTYFDQQGLTNAAVNGANANIKDMGTLQEFIKMSAKLAAGAGEMSPEHASYAIMSAMQGNAESLKQFYGVNADKDTLNMLAAKTSMGMTDSGRLMALRQLIDMRYGRDEGIIDLAANTGPGAWATIQDAIRTPMRKFGEPMYKEGVKGLVEFKDALTDFIFSDTFKEFQTGVGLKLEKVGVKFREVMHVLSVNLERLPEIWKKVEPVVGGMLKWGGVILGLNVAVFAFRGAAYLLTSTLLSAAKVFAPVTAFFTNPLLAAGILVAASALYPFIQNTEIAGKTTREWVDSLKKASEQKDWYKFFMEPLSALKGFIHDLREGKDALFSFSSQFKKVGLFKDIADVVTPPLKGLGRALMDTFPALSKVSGALGGFEQHLPLLSKAAVGLLGLAAAGKTLITLSPLLAGVSRVFGGLAMVGRGLGFLASPALLGLGLGAAAISYPLIKDLNVAGKSIDGWFNDVQQRAQRTDWSKVFQAPANALRHVVDYFSRASFDPMVFWRNLFAPQSVIGRIQGIFDPIWKGFLKSLDDQFPEMKGWFSKFSNAGETAFKAIETAGNIVIPVIKGIYDVLQPVVTWMLKLGAAVVGIAWDGLTSALSALERVFGSTNIQRNLQDFGKALGGIAVGAGAIWTLAKVVPVLTNALDGVRTMFSSPLGRLGLVVAAATIVATAVTLKTNEVWDRARTAGVWAEVSGTKAGDGFSTGNKFAQAAKDQYSKDASTNDSIAALVGVVQGLTGRSWNQNFLEMTEAERKKYGNFQKGIDDSKDTGKDMADKLLVLFDTVRGESGKFKKGTDDYKAFQAADNSLKTLRELVAEGGSEKDISKAFDRFMRNMHYFARTRTAGEELLPENLDDGWGLGSWQILPEIKNGARNLNSDIGGAMPTDMGGATPRTGSGETVVHFNLDSISIPVTIYAQQAEVIDEAVLERMLRGRIEEGVRHILQNALQNQSNP